ncbi:MAG: hypothetical protein KKE79_02535 [Actinobacteria bacterium]|nr:hypothetical protein [Actinomycetota bacterium]MBU4241207.1 hypothetical protein [Actinomycetota bacterium]MBU4489492.1 hypothetical protein [Actinomycetota bacterium]
MSGQEAGDETQTVPPGSQREKNMNYVQDPKKQVGYLQHQQCLSSDKKPLSLFLYGVRSFA